MEKYILVKHHQEHVFIELVNQKIKEGYMPLGGVAVKSIDFYQAMILKE
ncbi:hypothetical protein [Flavobacterium davisii]